MYTERLKWPKFMNSVPVASKNEWSKWRIVALVANSNGEWSTLRNTDWLFIGPVTSLIRERSMISSMPTFKMLNRNLKILPVTKTVFWISGCSISIVEKQF